jgi:pimeloyl-ACP methyl ester carboxylesterase
MGIESWWAGGRRVHAGGHDIWVRVEGPENGRWVTLLHGFPTCAYDWEPIVPALTEAGYRLLLFDFLGYGDSDKPATAITYPDQLRILDDLWAQNGVETTKVIAHDYGVSVAQELLARGDDHVESVAFLNGGLFARLHRRTRGQELLLKPVVGPLIARLMNEARFAAALRGIFSKGHQPTDAELHEHWLGVSRRRGTRNYHRLIHYIDERLENEERWTNAIAAPGKPIAFVWGDADPVSGKHMIDEVRSIVPEATPIATRADIAHYPQLEDPEWVANELVEFLNDGRNASG